MAAFAMAKNAKTTKRVLVPPDGGWGWIVVLGAAISNTVTQALLSVFGLLFADTLHDMGEGTTGAALLSNFMVATTNFSGLLTGPIMRRFSYRTVALAGGLFTAVGMMLTSVATTMGHMIFTYSFCVGLGLGLLAPSTFVAINTYFQRARGRAVGIGMAGTGLGQMLMPQAVRMLLDEYSFRGTVLILGAIALNSLVGSMLFHPVQWHARPESLPEDERVPLQRGLQRSGAGSALSLCSEEVSMIVKDAEKGNGSSEKMNKDTSEKRILDKSISTDESKVKVIDPDISETCWSKIVSLFDLDLLRDASFVNLVIGLAAVYTAGINFGMVFPFFLASVGLHRSEIALCMSLLAGADIACRLILPLITEHAKLKSRTVFLVGSLCLASIRSLMALQTDLTYIMAVSVLCGFVRGSTTVNLNLSISESCTAEKLPAALGINMVLKGISILIIGPFIGWFRDETDSFPLCMHVLSVLIVIPMLIWILELLINRVRHDR